MTTIKSSLSSEFNEEIKREQEKLDPEARKVADGIRTFQAVVRERDSLKTSCANLTKELNNARANLERTQSELRATQRERDHYLKMLSACSAQSQMLIDTASAMMANIKSVREYEHTGNSTTATLASRLAIVKAVE